MRKPILVALLGLALPAAAFAADTPSPTGLAKTACQSERGQSGTQTFKVIYAAKSTSTAMTACVDKRDGAAATNLKNAAQACKAERAADPAAFTTKYGTNKNGRNAYGKCVSAKAREAAAQQTTARVNAAKSCKKLKSEQKAQFEQAYGTKKSAFGKCVSKMARAS